jgi:predicted outer membrane protein
MKRSAAALALALLAAGCSTKRAPAPAPVTPAPPPQVILTPAPGQVMAPRTYVTTSSTFEMFVLRASELAATRSLSPRVRAYASRELEDHRGLSAQLSFAGRGLNLLPPRAMWKSDAQRLAELEAASDFDALYRKSMIAAHQHHLSLNRDIAERGTSPTLRPVARNAAKVIARHLEQLRAL